MFWLQLPALVLGVAVLVVATVAVIRARREDIPEIFVAFAAGAFRRSRWITGSASCRSNLTENKTTSNQLPDAHQEAR